MAVQWDSGIRALQAGVAAACLVATAACGGGGSFTAAPTQGTSAAPTTSTAATTTATTGAPTTTAPTTASATETGSGGPLETDDAGRRLTLRDFFEPGSSWEEERYDVAGQQDVQGIATDVSSCYGFQREDALELRLGNNFETLELSVAQADDSRSSDQQLTVQVLANNAQVEIRSVPFNEVLTLSIPVEGVNALRIELALDEDDPECSGAVTAVLTDVEVR
ncbi:hypothetical protein SAMN05660464_0332 [Geodermatophilus dictyosporus]|uniref:NPCBM/NEW2 domain-containing protein n=1 Tax=Geodermatophilus dictyosporus TaxID=1523247 RepID=A0A1I5UN10_9ACTN|nr:hypothetical protein [Geodermatophilus dictyosporus]SFP96704.1 hypothetical protein SAMN05660464_0332 [Geodermatophilus dictyosporus]